LDSLQVQKGVAVKAKQVQRNFPVVEADHIEILGNETRHDLSEVPLECVDVERFRIASGRVDRLNRRYRI